MIYVKRDADNRIIAIFEKDTDGHLEKISPTDKEVTAFLAQCKLNKEQIFLKTDLELIRVIEDLIQILIAKNIISITDFPISAMEKLVARNKIREQYKGLTGIMDKL